MAKSVFTPMLRYEHFGTRILRNPSLTIGLCFWRIARMWETAGKEAVYWLEASREKLPESWRLKIHACYNGEFLWGFPSDRVLKEFVGSVGFARRLKQLGVSKGETAVLYVRLWYREA